MRIFNVNIQAPMITQTPTGFSFQMSNDGTSNDPIVLNLSKSPFDIKLTQVPSEIDLTVTNLATDPTATGVISSNENNDLILTVTLSDALPNTSGPLNLEDTTYAYLNGTFMYAV